MQSITVDSAVIRPYTPIPSSPIQPKDTSFLNRILSPHVAASKTPCRADPSPAHPSSAESGPIHPTAPTPRAEAEMKRCRCRWHEVSHFVQSDLSARARFERFGRDKAALQIALGVFRWVWCA